MQKLLLWDIDGTLLASRPGVGDTLTQEFVEAASKASGREDLSPPDTVHGSTDFAIFHEIFANSGFTRKEADWLLPQAYVHLNEATSSPSYIDRTRRLVPGAKEALVSLDKRGFRQTYATGNLPARAQAKTGFFSLDSYLDATIGGFGFWSKRRSDFLLHAYDLAKVKYGQDFQGVVIGDTPADIKGARQAGFLAVAVAGGNYGEEELTEADLVIANYQGEDLTKLETFLLL